MADSYEQREATYRRNNSLYAGALGPGYNNQSGRQTTGLQSKRRKKKGRGGARGGGHGSSDHRCAYLRSEYEGGDELVIVYPDALVARKNVMSGMDEGHIRDMKVGERVAVLEAEDQGVAGLKY